MEPLSLLALLAVGAVAVSLATRGETVYAQPSGHKVGAKGFVEADPRELARTANAPLDVYALASMMVSEAGSNEFLRLAVGWAAQNMAASRGESAFALLTRAGLNDDRGRLVRHESHGFFGPGNVGPRYASTRLTPDVPALVLAAQIIDDEIPDPTGGCTRFDAPKVQDAFLGKVAGYEKSAADVAEERSRGADLVMLPGISSTRFWRPRVG